MAGRVIQGFFIGGAMRPVAETTPRPASGVGLPAQPGPPRPAFAQPAFAQRAATVQSRLAAGHAPVVPGVSLAQARGTGSSFEIDPAKVGLVRSGGQPLPGPVLAKMEAAFSADFSSVRIHVGPQASRIGAIAFTTGNDIYFTPGRYQPNSIQGQQLLGHELAHVIQQRQGRVRAGGTGLSVVQDRTLEAEADRLGQRAAAHRAQAGPGGPAITTRGWVGGGAPIQRSTERVSRSVRKTQLQLDEIYGKLTEFWKKNRKAGSLNADIKLESKKGHSCSAKAILRDGTEVTGAFDSEEFHAEMDLLDQVQASGNGLSDITSIEIEKEPCPRCAVVLSQLDLSGLVTYKKSGQKDYPTWRFPKIFGDKGAGLLQVTSYVTDENDIGYLVKQFSTTKWW